MRSVVTWLSLVLSLMLGLGMGELILSQDLPPEMRADQCLLEGKRALAHDEPATAVMRRVASLAPPLAAGRMATPTGDQLTESPAKNRCEASALPLPQVRLVKDVLTAMPDKCNEKLLGTWYCGIHCYRGDCVARGGEETFRLSVDPDGYERIHRRWVDSTGDVYQSEYRVERQWGSAAGNNPLETGKLVAPSCNGRWNGQGTFSINIKTPDGSFRREVIYRMNSNGKTIRRLIVKVRWVGDTPHKKILSEEHCWRELNR